MNESVNNAHTGVGTAWERYYAAGMISKESKAFKSGYSEGVDSVTNYIGCLHPETTLVDILKSIDDAIESRYSLYVYQPEGQIRRTSN